MRGDVSPVMSNLFDARLSTLVFVIGSRHEMMPLGARNQKQSGVKSLNTPSALSDSLESNFISGDEAHLAGSMLSITSLPTFST